jgi:myo-inositol-1(or 4)-monophosphatase
MSDWEPKLLKTALEAAARATEVIRESYDHDLEVTTKTSASDLVTQVDLASERAIREVILSHHPDHSILGEEGGLTGESPYRWVIDPIDGTSNFARSLPHFCVSIGLEHGGAGVLGVIADPNLNHVYSAVRGMGASKDEQPIRVSGCNRVAEATVAMGYRSDPATLARVLPVWGHLSRHVVALRRMGSTALELALLAEGVIDGYLGFGQGAWDIAAGMVLVTEAGGVVKTFDAGTTLIAASSGELLDELEGILSSGEG